MANKGMQSDNQDNPREANQQGGMMGEDFFENSAEDEDSAEQEENTGKPVAPTPYQPKYPIFNAGDLQKMAANSPLAEVEFLPFLGDKDVQLFVKGWSHLLSAYPKTGKTELVANLAASWDFMGYKVLYLTEEPESIWIARLNRMPKGLKNMDLIFALGMMRGEIMYIIRFRPYDILIIDTVRLMGLRDENNNSEIYLRIAPIIGTCRLRKSTLILVHHNRKGGGEHGEAASGGHAFLGIVDIGLELRRDKAENRRVIKGLGRILDLKEILYELGEDGKFAVLGEASMMSLEETKQRVQAVLTDHWLTTNDVRERMGEPRPSNEGLRKALIALAEEGKAFREPGMEEGPLPGRVYMWKLPSPEGVQDTAFNGAAKLE